MPDQRSNGPTEAGPTTEEPTSDGRIIDAEVTEETAAAPAPTASPPARGRPWLALLALLIAIAGWVVGYLVWQQLQAAAATQRGEQASQEGQVAGQLAGLGQGLQKAARESGELGQRLARQAAALKRQQEVTEQTYAALRKQIGQDRNRWIIAESEYLMRVANHRLQLARDIPSALAALAAADQRLGELADPSLISVRAQVADETAALRAVPKVDIEGLALALGSLAKRVETLPVLGARFRPGEKGVAPSADPLEAARESATWKEAANAVWGEVKQLVDVRRNDEPVKPMLAPEHEYFLYQNLRLQIDSARLALLRGEAPLFGESLRGARDWATGYFEQEAPTTRSLVAELERLIEVDIAPPLPDISGSLRTLRRAPAYRSANNGEGAS